jgi:molybdate transport system substrate-binding protein
MRRNVLVAAAVVVALTLGACGSSKPKAKATTTTGPKGGAPVTVYTVPALESIVNQVVHGYNTIHPKTPLRVATENSTAMKKSLTSSQPQIVIGPAAAFKGAGSAVHQASFGRSLAIIAVATGNPHHVTGVAAFASSSGLRTAVCGPQTTLGNFGALVLTKDHIKPNPASVSLNCGGAALKKLLAGQLDAVLVYRTGFKPPKLTFVTIPEAQNVIVPFTYGAIGKAASITLFVQYLALPTAQRLLTKGGYLP